MEGRQKVCVSYTTSLSSSLFFPSLCLIIKKSGLCSPLPRYRASPLWWGKNELWFFWAPVLSMPCPEFSSYSTTTKSCQDGQVSWTFKRSQKCWFMYLLNCGCWQRIFFKKLSSVQVNRACLWALAGLWSSTYGLCYRRERFLAAPWVDQPGAVLSWTASGVQKRYASHSSVHFTSINSF